MLTPKRKSKFTTEEEASIENVLVYENGTVLGSIEMDATQEDNATSLPKSCENISCKNDENKSDIMVNSSSPVNQLNLIVEKDLNSPVKQGDLYLSESSKFQRNDILNQLRCSSSTLSSISSLSSSLLLPTMPVNHSSGLFSNGIENGNSDYQQVEQFLNASSASNETCRSKHSWSRSKIRKYSQPGDTYDCLPRYTALRMEDPQQLTGEITRVALPEYERRNSEEDNQRYVCWLKKPSLPFIIGILALGGVACTLGGIVLGSTGLIEHSTQYLSAALLMIGIGVSLLVISGAIWRLSIPDEVEACPCFRHMEACQNCNNAFCNSQLISGRYIYPEFQHRPPPPSYITSLFEVFGDPHTNSRRFDPITVRTPPPSYRSYSLNSIGTNLPNCTAPIENDEEISVTIENRDNNLKESQEQISINI